MEEQRDKQNRKGKRRERTRAKDAADLFASSSPRLCSICCPKRPHHRQRSPPRPLAHIAQGERRAATPSGSGRCHRHTSPPSRHRSTSKQQGSASTVCHPARLPASSPSSSPLPGGEGMAASQPGRAIPCLSPCRPSPPCRGASAYLRTPPERGGQRAAISGRRG